jgi:glycosyltransferase involved in cell wall biosynthesis
MDRTDKIMIIGVDIRDLKLAKTGTKTYLEEMCRAFENLQHPGAAFVFLDTTIPIYTGSGKIAKYLEHFRYQLWKQVILPVKAMLNKCDYLLCTDNFVPLLHLGYQTVPVFHDAFFFENPEHYGKLWLKLYHLTAIPAAKRSAFIVTPSMYARQQIHRYSHIPLEKLEVIYEGPKTLDRMPDNQVLEQFKLLTGNYILHVGSMFKRKNIPLLIQAFAELKMQIPTSVKLVLAGPSSASKDSNDFELILEAIAAHHLQDEVILTGYLSDNQLASMYANALMYIFPSVNEGFGIPVLEAFSYNLPVLVADNTCLPEVGADAVLTFNPFDAKDISQKMKMVIDDEELRNNLRHRGQLRLANFSWKKSAIQLVELLQLHFRNNKS